MFCTCSRKCKTPAWSRPGVSPDSAKCLATTWESVAQHSCLDKELCTNPQEEKRRNREWWWPLFDWRYLKPKKPASFHVFWKLLWRYGTMWRYVALSKTKKKPVFCVLLNTKNDSPPNSPMQGHEQSKIVDADCHVSLHWPIFSPHLFLAKDPDF